MSKLKNRMLVLGLVFVFACSIIVLGESPTEKSAPFDPSQDLPTASAAVMLTENDAGWQVYDPSHTGDSSSRYYIQGITFDAEGADYAVEINSSSNYVTFSNCIFMGTTLDNVIPPQDENDVPENRYNIAAVRIYNSNHITFQQCSFINSFTGALINASASTDIQFLQCNFYDLSYDGIYVADSGFLSIDGNYFWNIGDTAILSVSRSSGVLARNTIYNSTSNGIVVLEETSHTYSENIIQNCGLNGMYFSDVLNPTISQNIISYCKVGIFDLGCDNGLISQNEIRHTIWNAMFVSSVNTTEISNNWIQYNELDGISICDTNNALHPNIKIHNNNFTSNGVSLRISNGLEAVVEHNWIEDSVDSGCSIDYSENCLVNENWFIDGEGIGYFDYASDSNNASNNYFDVVGGNALKVQGSNNTILTYNEILYCESNGIYIDAYNSVVQYNYIYHAGLNGIEVAGSGNTIEKNSPTFCQQNGIVVLGSSNYIINDNGISYNQLSGIVVGGNDNLVQSNIISNNHQQGIYINGTNNEITSNTLKNNDYDGIAVSGYNALIMYNRFVDNGIHIIQTTTYEMGSHFISHNYLSTDPTSELFYESNKDNLVITNIGIGITNEVITEDDDSLLFLRHRAETSSLSVEIYYNLTGTNQHCFLTYSSVPTTNPSPGYFYYDYNNENSSRIYLNSVNCTGLPGTAAWYEDCKLVISYTAYHPHSIALVNCDNADIENVVTNPGSIGIQLFNCQGTIMDGVTVSDNRNYNLLMEQCDETTITSSTFGSSDHTNIYYQGDDLEFSDSTVGSAGSTGIYLEADSCTLDNIDVSDASAEGIYLDGDSNVIIDCSIDGSGSNGLYITGTSNSVNRTVITSSGASGIVLNHTSLCNIQNTNISTVVNYGIQIISSYKAYILHDRMTSPTAVGIKMENSLTCTLISNTMFGQGIVLSGTTLNNYRTHRIEGNTRNGLDIRFYVDLVKTRFSAENTGQLIIVNCNRSTFEQFGISNCYYGVSMYYCSNDLFNAGCTLTNNYIDLYLEACTDMTVQGISFNSGPYDYSDVFLYLCSNLNIVGCNHTYGIHAGYISASSNIQIQDAIISIVSQEALYLVNSEYTSILNCQFENDLANLISASNCNNDYYYGNYFTSFVSDAIYLSNCVEMNIEVNTFYESGVGAVGIDLYNSDNCEIYGNNFTKLPEGTGVRVRFGSTNNIIRWNSFVSEVSNELEYGVRLLATDNDVKENTFQGVNVGIYATSGNQYLYRNYFYDNDKAIYLVGSSNTELEMNEAYRSLDIAFHITSSSTSVKLYKNIMSTNNYAIVIVSSNYCNISFNKYCNNTKNLNLTNVQYLYNEWNTQCIIGEGTDGNDGDILSPDDEQNLPYNEVDEFQWVEDFQQAFYGFMSNYWWAVGLAAVIIYLGFTPNGQRIWKTKILWKLKRER